MQPTFTKCPAIFLDFDGTIRRSKSGAKFIKNAADVELIEGSEDVLWDWRNKGFLILGVTNQGGAAYGFRSREDILEEIRTTLMLFKSNPISAMTVSFAHPKGTVPDLAYRSLLRKPSYGMLVQHEIEQLKKDRILDYDKSVFVGDRDDDRLCAEAAGVAFQWAWKFFNRTEAAPDY